jgi:hypothetical protein
MKAIKLILALPLLIIATVCLVWPKRTAEK